MIQPFEAPTPEARQALLEDIRRRGIVYPVVVNQAGDIIDGNTRDDIARELGITYPTITVETRSDDEREELARVLNGLRRHLDPEARQANMVRLRELGMTTQAIAAQVGVNQSTVSRQLAKAKVKPVVVTDSLGRQNPGRPPRREPQHMRNAIHSSRTAGELARMASKAARGFLSGPVGRERVALRLLVDEAREGTVAKPNMGNLKPLQELLDTITQVAQELEEWTTALEQALETAKAKRAAGEPIS